MKCRRLILSGLALLYLSILLTGCQLQGKNDPVDGNGMPDSAAVVDWSNSLSGQMPEQDDPARLVIVADANDGVFLNSTLVDFNRENPQYSVTLEMAEENSEMFRTRIMADIMAGGGPDILCVSPEDMEILAQAGALVDLEQLISGETLEMLLPGVLQMGRCGGRFMGVAPQVMTETLITSDSTWTEDSWTLEDFLTLAEQKEGLEGLLTYGSVDMSERNVLLNLVGRDLENSRFLDMENGISRFEQEDFMRVLEIIKQYTSNSASSYVDGDKRVAEGTYLAEYSHIFSPLDFYNMNADIDGGGHVVGFPTASGAGSYIGDRGLLVVNAKSEKLESVTAFLEYLLSFENQSALELQSLSVRSDMADRLVVYFDALDSYGWQGKTGVLLLASRADGTTYTEEYNDYLQSCVPVKDVSPIFEIIWDEAQSYFAGAKDALTVTRAIDNRVQVYLDERK